jgi:hypothetical protein
MEALIDPHSFTSKHRRLHPKRLITTTSNVKWPFICQEQHRCEPSHIIFVPGEIITALG